MRDYRPTHTGDDERPPMPLNRDERSALMQAEAMRDIALTLGAVAAAMDRIGAGMERVAEAIKGQRFATHVTATFGEKD